MALIDLTGLWRFQPDPAGLGQDYGYTHLDYDHYRWREVRLPADFETAHPALETYEGAGWFRRWVAVPDSWRGRRVCLHFEGVSARARVWVNGYDVGSCEDPFLPFDLDVRGQLSPGRENLLVVRVDNVRRSGDVPGRRRGWRNFGGILREVRLKATDPCYIDHVHTLAEPTEEGGRLDLEALVTNGRGDGVEVVLVAEVADMEGTVVAHEAGDGHLIPVGETAPLGLSLPIPGVKPWTPEDPQLYAVHLKLSEEGEIIEACDVRVGFRTVAAHEGRLWLNDEPFTLTGFNRHEDSPDTNMCPDPECVRADLVAIKEAGANFVRLCHYPHHPLELDLCDELGLLAMAEIPLYWWAGTAEDADLDAGKIVTAKTLEVAKRQLRALIRRDRNHPSIIFWSVSTETREERSEVAAGNTELVRLAQNLDPSRLAVHVSDRWQEHPAFEADDVICVNGYPSVGPLTRRGEKDYDLGASTAFWRDGLSCLHSRYPEKPILVTEFGYTSFHGLVDNAFGGELHARVIEAEFAGMDAPYVCGATIWCWADHPWPPATFDSCGYLAVSPYGVLTRDRRRKPAYWTARRLFRQEQGLVDQPGAAASSEPGPAGQELYMVRPHLDDIPQVPVPDGFRIRTLRPDEGGLWTDIWRDAEPYFHISDELFHRQFGDDLEALQWRSFVVENEKGVGVATITAWYNRTYKGQDYGQIHWVAVRQGYWGRGLAKAMMTSALNQMATWHDKAFLGTQTKRLAAIKVYLDFGFVPDLDREGAHEAWREVKEALDHPVLNAMAL
ncbi:MAG: GNAT family N-acetyltransferase [Anaerolineae bacterium]